MAKHKDHLQGTIDLLVLRTLAAGGPLHGYAISDRIQIVSRETLRVEEGSLYPALHRMEEAGWIASEWGASDNNRRARYYTITRKGRRQLVDAEAKWARLVSGVARVLKQV
jgi:PadR family transcriptional regulator, regulatory protein PadR